MTDPFSRALNWLQAHDECPRLHLYCNHILAPIPPHNEVALQWNSCLSEVSLHVPARLLANSVSTVVVHACPQAIRNCQNWEKIFRNLRTELVTKTVLDEEKISIIQKLNPISKRVGVVLHLDTVPLPRRALFNPSSLIDDDIQSPNQRMCAALDYLESTGGLNDCAYEILQEIPADSFKFRVENCQACGVCTRSCPKGAWEMFSSHIRESGFASSDQIRFLTCLFHQPRNCVKCGICIKMCKFNAIKVIGSVSWFEIWKVSDDSSSSDSEQTTCEMRASGRQMTEVITTPCVLCKNLHPASEGFTCALCTWREKHPFESLIPTG